MRFVFLAAAIIFCSGCTELGAGVANIPAYLNGQPVAENLSYGPHDLNRLDVYAPENARQAPVIVFFHGGRWQQGSKNIYKFVGQRFVSLGYVVVIPDYRKFPQVKYPEFVREGAKAIQWVQDNASRYGGNPQQIFLMGHSSGAHTAAMLSVNENYLPDGIVKGFAGLAGPFDFIPQAEDIRAIFGPPANFPKLRVTGYVDANDPPMLLLHGSADEAVKLSNLKKLKAGLNRHGVRVESKIYPDISHAGIVEALTWVYDDKAPVAQDVNEFFRSLVLGDKEGVQP